MTWSRFNYSRKLIGSLIIAIALALFFKDNFSLVVFIGGFLFFEHYFIWARWDFFDYITGHEWWGIYLMFGGFISISEFSIAFMIIIGFLIGATYKKFNPFETIKEIFKNYNGKK